MVNIGEISKPSGGVSPKKPRRSKSDSEISTAADNVGSTVKVSSQIYPKNQKKSKNNKELESKQLNKKLDVSQQDEEADEENIEIDMGNKTSRDEVCIDDTSYDEKGHLSHHGKIDIKA